MSKWQDAPAKNIISRRFIVMFSRGLHLGMDGSWMDVQGSKYN